MFDCKQDEGCVLVAVKPEESVASASLLCFEAVFGEVDCTAFSGLMLALEFLFMGVFICWHH